MPDAVVVGSGPNGLSAAVTLARAGLAVELYEAAPTVGGGMRTMELMRQGYVHDMCSAVHPMALASPFFTAFGLRNRTEMLVPDISFATPLDDGRAALAYRSLERTAVELGRDGLAYQSLMAPLVERLSGILDLTQNQLLRIPREPIAAAVFAARVLEQGTRMWGLRFREDLAPALISGLAGHAITRQPALTSAAAGLMLGALGHAEGWPIPVGGSGAIAAALTEDFQAHGGIVHTNHRVDSLAELPASRATLLDIAPAGLTRLAGGALPPRYAKAMAAFRYGSASCKVDYILSGPVPWADPRLAGAGTLHVGGTRAELAASENDVAAGRHPKRPYVLVSQPSTFDSTRAPSGHHVLWTYCHAPAGSTVDMSEAITAQLERFAPGFRDLVVDHHVTTGQQLADYNENYVGGDFSSGIMDLRGLIRRPVISRVPWKTPLPGVYLCSSSTPPGPGVTGMPGFLAAREVLGSIFGKGTPYLGHRGT